MKCEASLNNNKALYVCGRFFLILLLDCKQEGLMLSRDPRPRHLQPEKMWMCFQLNTQTCLPLWDSGTLTHSPGEQHSSINIPLFHGGTL